jgi:hypothetical protein
MEVHVIVFDMKYVPLQILVKQGVIVNSLHLQITVIVNSLHLQITVIVNSLHLQITVFVNIVKI